MRARVSRYAEADLPTRYGSLRLYVYRTEAGASGSLVEHMAIARGDLSAARNVLTRVHSECWTSEVLGSLRCDCREQLDSALDLISGDGQGLVIYLRQEGRGIGLGNKVRAYALQNDGADTVEANLALGFEADERTYEIAAAIVRDLGVASIRLLTNNPKKVAGLRACGVSVTDRISHWVGENRHNAGYLAVKRRKLGHHPQGAGALRLVHKAPKS